MKHSRQCIGAFGLLGFAALGCLALTSRAEAGAPELASTFAVQGNHVERLKREQSIGPVDDGVVLTNLSVHLRRPANRQAALDNLIDQQKNPRSPNYHLWLTPKELDDIYGPDAATRAALTRWLVGQGMRNVRVTAGGMDIKFDATAGSLRSAFGTALQKFEAGGQTHIANVDDPVLPLEFKSIVAGVYPLHDFKPTPQVRRYDPVQAAARSKSGIRPQFTWDYGGYNYYLIGPADFAKIYNVKPVWASGITGKGQTITVPEPSDILPTDWQSFRSQFGLGSFAGSLATVHPGCAAPFQDPGFEFEAALDAEWASVAAPDANIQVASCPSTATSFGALTAIENLLNAASPPAILSFSYATCEDLADTATTTYISDLWQQAAAEGTSVFVASGDGASAWCDIYAGGANNDGMVHGGLSVNAYAVSPYATAVGGTAFTPQLTNQTAQYWDKTPSTAANGYLSALSYIPEMAWNDTCGNELQASAFGYANALAFCNAEVNWYPAYNGGTTGGYSVSNQQTPSWQVGVPGAPVTGTRGIPDVAIASGGGLGNTWMVACMSDPNANGTPCDYTQGANGNFALGASFSAPAFAGIQALINQKLGTRQGNPNYALYQIGRLEYGSGAAGFGSLSTCASTLGASMGTNCVFIDTVQGSNAVPCAPGTANCFAMAGQSTGLTSQSTTSFQPAFPATPGWDYTTGLGSVNVTNLVNAVATVDTYVADNYVDGDVNGDGNADVIFQGVGFNEFGRWILHRGEISHVIEESSGANDHIAAVGDLDGDGKSDVVWQRSDGTVTVWLSRGEGAYQKVSEGAAPVGAAVVAAFDADGDGYADLIMVNPSTQLATVWRMVGASKAQTWTETLPAGAVVHGSADFDKDGLEDLAVTSGGNVALLLSLPGGNFTATALGAIPAGTALAGAEDIDGDGKRDLVFFNATTNLVTVWFMNDTTVKTVEGFSLPAGESVAGLGDFDGDGHADVLTQNSVRHLSFWSRLTSGGYSEHGIGLASSAVPTRWSVFAAQTH